MRIYRLQHPEVAERNKERTREKLVEYKNAAFTKLGNKCSNPACQWLNSDGSRGCTDMRCLQVDHIFGDGAAERRGRTGKAKSSNSYRLYRLVLADMENRYQLLCANCNWIKRVENKEHPHVH